MASPQPPTDRHSFRIAIICARPREADAVALLFDHLWHEGADMYGQAPGDRNTYITGRIGDHNVVLAILPETGTKGAAAGAVSLRLSFTGLRLALIVGVCGGVPHISNCDAFLGDVVVSKSIIQYDYGRQYHGSFAVKNSVEDRLARPNKDIRGLLAVFETEMMKVWLQNQAAKYLGDLQNAARKKRRRANYQYPGADNDSLYAADYAHKHQSLCDVCASDSYVFCDAASQASCAETGCDAAKLITRERFLEVAQGASFTPRIFIGRVGSGNRAMKSGEDRDQFAAKYDIIAFEMEGAGAWDEVPCMIVKGICNYADSHPNKDQGHPDGRSIMSNSFGDGTRIMQGDMTGDSTFGPLRDVDAFLSEFWN